MEAFKRIIGGHGEDVPATFPICWLGQKDIRHAVEEACRGRLPLHEAQTFDYLRPLELNCDYQLMLHVEEQADPRRVVLQGEVLSARSADLCLRMETLLRLLELPVRELQA